MVDSWEDLDQQPHAQASAQRKAAGAGLNPNASSFSFNPSASTFTPNFAPKATTATPTAQPVQESASPASAQPQGVEQTSHAATNGFADHEETAEPMQVDPPSEREVPVTSASTPPEDVDQDLHKANGQVSEGMQCMHPLL